MKSKLEDVVRPGEVVGGYRIGKKLGAGGYGKVFLAWRGDGSPCALKFIHLASVGEWGWRELFIMLRHEFPNVVKLLSHCLPPGAHRPGEGRLRGGRLPAPRRCQGLALPGGRSLLPCGQHHEGAG
ncbi:MAG TPA: hypothetical protein VEU50_26965, partial [Archangium sp.]|nr:hypothetical protein [Archangium sp.]